MNRITLTSSSEMTIPATTLDPTQDGIFSLYTFRLAEKLAHLVYDLTIALPPGYEDLANRIRGAVGNVLGGLGAKHGPDAVTSYVYFCNRARNDLTELGSYLAFCRSRGLLTEPETGRALDLQQQLARILEILVRVLSRQGSAVNCALSQSRSEDLWGGRCA